MKKHTKDIFIYNISYKILIGSKPLPDKFDKIDGFIWIYDGTRYLKLFGSEKDGVYDSLRIEKALTLHDVPILIKSIINEDKNCYHYNRFLEKSPYQLPKK